MSPESSATPSIPFDPLRETAKARIRILDRADGGKEFILPALRNFGEKVALSLLWVFMTFCLVVVGFVSHSVAREFPAIVRFFIINHTWFTLLILGVIDLVVTIVVLDVWLRASRITATRSRLQVVTRWLFFKRTVVIPAPDIIEIKASNTTTVNTTRYYDLIVLSRGNRPGWLAAHFPATQRAGSSFTENDLKTFSTGGKKIAAATGIEGQSEAEWLLAQLRLALGVNV